MTREEAVAYGKRVIDLGLNDETQAFCELAIQALENELCEDAVSKTEVENILYLYHVDNSNEDVINAIEKLPSIQSKVKTGHWITEPDDNETMYCSECNLRLVDEQTYMPLHYCHNCGAKMSDSQEVMSK